MRLFRVIDARMSLGTFIGEGRRPAPHRRTEVRLGTHTRHVVAAVGAPVHLLRRRYVPSPAVRAMAHPTLVAAVGTAVAPACRDSAVMPIGLYEDTMDVGSAAGVPVVTAGTVDPTPAKFAASRDPLQGLVFLGGPWQTPAPSRTGVGTGPVAGQPVDQVSPRDAGRLAARHPRPIDDGAATPPPHAGS